MASGGTRTKFMLRTHFLASIQPSLFARSMASVIHMNFRGTASDVCRWRISAWVFSWWRVLARSRGQRYGPNPRWCPFCLTDIGKTRGKLAQRDALKRQRSVSKPKATDRLIRIGGLFLFCGGWKQTNHKSSEETHRILFWGLNGRCL